MNLSTGRQTLEFEMNVPINNTYSQFNMFVTAWNTSASARVRIYQILLSN